jgi:hypothetical protein
MTDDEGLWSDEINAFVDAAFESGIVSRNPSDAEQHTAYRYATKLAIDESRKHGYDHGYYDGRTYQLPQTDALKIAREAIEKCAAQMHLTSEDAAKEFRAALEARGLEIREKGQ